MKVYYKTSNNGYDTPELSLTCGNAIEILIDGYAILAVVKNKNYHPNGYLETNFFYKEKIKKYHDKENNICETNEIFISNKKNAYNFEELINIIYKYKI